MKRYYLSTVTLPQTNRREAQRRAQPIVVSAIVRDAMLEPYPTAPVRLGQPVDAELSAKAPAFEGRLVPGRCKSGRGNNYRGQLKATHSTYAIAISDSLCQACDSRESVPSLLRHSGRYNAKETIG